MFEIHWEKLGLFLELLGGVATFIAIVIWAFNRFFLKPDKNEDSSVNL
jgi:hypothetical protein